MRYDLNLYGDDDRVVTLPPSGQTINVNEQTDMTVVDFENIGHVKVATIVSSLDRIPQTVEEVAYLVPMRALLAMHEQGFDTSDVYAPNLLVKDETGRVIGCRRLMQMPKR
jgi:hypothetical protein